MLGQTWYFGQIKKYVVLFGTLFNDIKIFRTKEGQIDQIIHVPIQYAAKEKMQARLDEDPDIARPFSALLPRMSFEYKAFRYSPKTKLQTINKVVKEIDGDPNKLKYQYMPVPWDIDWSLYVYAKNTEDGCKIIEQIFPYFTPSYTTTINLIPEMDVNIDIPVSLMGVGQTDNYDDRFEQRRYIIWEFQFTMKAYFFGPIRENGIIKVANTSFYIANTADGNIRDVVGLIPVSERIVLGPGLDANGNPVNYDGTKPADVDAVPYLEVNEDDNFGYIIEHESVVIGEPRPSGGANSEINDDQTGDE